ncbi:MAG: tRNA lysidine(34) synthetase TilS [Myxococcota bacterium]
MDLAELESLLSGLRSRGEVKRLGARADRDPGLRAALVSLLRSRGVEDAASLPGKKLVRRALDRSSDAQVRTNPIHRDEAFRCVWCDAEMAPGGAQVRDHCTQCLRSLHVDVVPGDRAAGCGGVMHPTGFTLSDGTQTITIAYRCGRCGWTHAVRAHPDDAIPPSLDPNDLPGRRWKGAPRARALPKRVLDFILRQRLWGPGDRVVVAVSGGVDSTVLMHLLAETAGAHRGRLEIVSLDHQLRDDAAQEVESVGAQAEALGLPFYSARLEIPPGPDLYARARESRRAALLSRGADRIATGHHRTDQAETVLHHLLRGSGSRGLRGMVPLAVPWCRPLLDEPRDVLVDWAKQRGLRWSEDPSNARSQRGAIRALMPQLDALHGGAATALARSGRLLGREDDFLRAFAEQRWAAVFAPERGLLVASLRGEHPAIQLRLLRRLTVGCPGTVRADQLEAFLTWQPQRGGALPLPGGWSLRFDGAYLSAGPNKSD